MFGTSIPISMLKAYAVAFYVLQRGLTTAQFAAILFWYTFIDALDNPVYGFLSDRTRTRWGRRRPWLVIGTPLLVLAFVAFYSTPAFLTGRSLFAYAMLFYILTGTLDSVINANYGALFPELFRTDDSRASTNALRQAFQLVAMIISIALTPMVTKALGYGLTAIIYGLLGGAWQRYSSIETYANAYGLVVVMPSAGRSFYADQPNGQRYFSYLVDELPQYLADVFGLAPGRERTLIAGTSMGGYGAIKAALLHPERFAAAASLSGFLSLAFLQAFANDPRRGEFAHVFGDLERLVGSEHDPAVWLRRAVEHPQALPRLFVASGRQEDLYPLNLQFVADCRALGIPVEYHEEDARHDWFFWDGQIRRFLAAVLGPLS